jgi:hypothetical protein
MLENIILFDILKNNIDNYEQTGIYHKKCRAI